MAKVHAPGQADRIGDDVAGTVAIEYALIGGMVVTAILATLQVIGQDAMLGLPPIINALQN